VSGLLRRAWVLLRGSLGPRGGYALNGFFEQLLQKFEDSRSGLSAAMLADPAQAARFFLDLYEREVPRLRGALRAHAPHLTPGDRARLEADADAHVRRVVLPTYVRLATAFTASERNGFYLLGPGLHGLERVVWAAGGLLLGAFIVWAPFIPIWSKEIILPLGIAGLLFPNLRQVLSIRRYEGELNQLLIHTDREMDRLDLAFLGVAEPAGLGPATLAGGVAAAGAASSEADTEPVEGEEEAATRPEGRVEQGERQ
jgi:hypothetical protein